MKIRIHGKGEIKTAYIHCPVCKKNEVKIGYFGNAMQSFFCFKCGKYQIISIAKQVKVVEAANWFLDYVMKSEIVEAGIYECLEISNSRILINGISNNESYTSLIDGGHECRISNKSLNHDELKQMVKRYNSLTIFS